jgi:ubiquinone/menaquinone biosynthesis C-methylase UbiE
MPFGYIPHKTPWKNAISKILGNPNMMRRIQASAIMRMLNPRGNDVVLDAGCGGGFFTYEIAKICRCIGIDWNISENLSYAMRRLPSVAYMNADVQKMPFEDGTFDKILLSSVLQMVEDDEALLKECYQVLKDNGILVLSVPVEYMYIKKLNELKDELIEKFGSRGKGFYGYEEVIELLQKEGFEIMETEYAPKRLGSFIYEIWLYFCYRAGLPLFHLFYFPLLYPIAYFDKFGSKKQKGTEVIIKARKI